MADRARWVRTTTASALLLLASLQAPQTARASEGYAPTELDTEAVFLTRLVPFVDWPSEAFSSRKSPLVICAVATDPLAGRLAEAADSRKNGKRPIRVRFVSSVDALDNCHILYLGTVAAESATQIARIVRHRPVLTVSRSNGARYQTAMIVFAVDRGRVCFDIDNASAASSRLAISSKLLAIARNVTPAPQSQ